jgi:predicted dehydrogenase
VATRNALSAKEAADAFGADRWFSDPLEMMCDERIDIVTVSLRVAAHRDAVMAALAAGKAVYCEAPLGRSLAETEELAGAVRSQHTAIGLQGRMNPAVGRAAEIIASGKIGRPLSARVVSASVGFGPEIGSRNDDFYNKAAGGSNVLTVTTGHTLDLLEALLGPIIEMNARTEILWPFVKIIDTGETSVREVPDHIDVLGKTQSGAVFTAQMLAGMPVAEAEFSFKVRGSNGWLSLTSDHPYGFQAGNPKLESSVEFALPEAPAVSGGFIGAAINVGEVYASLVRDLRTGAYDTPGFKHALHSARVVDAVSVRARAASGSRSPPRCPNRREAALGGQEVPPSASRRDCGWSDSHGLILQRLVTTPG